VTSAGIAGRKGKERTVKRNSDRGAAAVEFALVVPVLLIVVFGIIDFGRMLSAQLQVSEAAREGARAASVITGDSSARADAANARISAFSASTVGGVQFDSTDSSFCSSNPAAGDDNVVVAEYDFHFITPVGDIGALFGGGRWGAAFTIRSKSVMPCRG
jgi:TadE-like protein